MEKETEKKKEECKTLVQNIIYILMGLQIGLGLLWIGANLGKIPGFEESIELLEMSETLCIDEYTAVLYPIGIRMMTSLGELVRLPYCSFLYMLQLIVAYWGYSCFLKKVVFYKAEMDAGLKNRIRFFACFILTIPPILQCHMAILPYSLASSLFMILLADVVVLWHKEVVLTTKQIVGIGMCWVLSAQLCPDYGWLAGFAVGVSVVGYMLRQRRVAAKLLIMLLVGLIGIGGLNSCLQTEGSFGKIQKSVGSAMLLRCVWPNFATFQHFWSGDVTELWDTNALVGLAMHPKNVIYEFGPIMEQAYGKERANEIYWEMAETAISLDTKNIVINMLKDGVAYICPPLTMFVQLRGVGVSFTGWNYGRMKDYAPQLTKYYVDYSLSMWIVILALSGICGLLSRAKNKKSTKALGTGSFLCLVSVMVNLWYIMFSGNMQDYKKLIVNSILWAMLIAKLLWEAETNATAPLSFSTAPEHFQSDK